MISRRPPLPIDADAMYRERQDFLEFLHSVTLADLAHVEPLPYRRVLDASESQRIWAALRDAWDMPPGCWYPLADTTRADVAAYDTDAFMMNVPTEVLHERLRRQGIRRIWELKEYGPEFEEAIELFAPLYDGAEGYWCSQGLDWIVYASHEGSITVGGSLVATIHDVWPHYSEHPWKPGTA